MTNEITKNGAGYTGYEYREIAVPEQYVSLCMDSYPCFGWETDPNKQGSSETSRYKAGGAGKTEKQTLSFRRNRNISNKVELTRLQRHFDSCVAELEALERAKTTQATIAALVIGLIGTAFLAGSTFAVVAEPPIIWLTVLLAIPGFAGWIIPYFAYRALSRKKTAEIEPLIEQKYDEIYELCEKGSHLLH